MIKVRIRLFFILLAVLIFAAGLLVKTTAQKSGDNFSHSKAAHKKINCNSCHKVPTTNWRSARQFPDVADYPGHDSCVQCHRSDFFRSNRPAICTVCHTNVSPRGEARFAFPMHNRSQEFTAIFPHNVHQDIIARVPKKYNNVAVAHFVNVKFTRVDDPPPPQFNNCAICHKTMADLPQYTTRSLLPAQPLTTPFAESFTARVEFFKDAPNSHASCFSCHYQSQKPVSTDCAGCHRLSSPYFETGVIRRYSLKFDHQEKEHAVKDCMACHVRITQNFDLRSMTDADVPILTCTQCHKARLKEEIDKRDSSIAAKQAVFQCNYCHTSEIGSFQIPLSHRNW